MMSITTMGRLSRRDWWRLALPAGLGLFVLAGVLDQVVVGHRASTFDGGFFVNSLVNGSFWWGPFRAVLGLAFLPFAIGFAVRRLHDLNTDAKLLWAGLGLLAAGPVATLVAGLLAIWPDALVRLSLLLVVRMAWLAIIPGLALLGVLALLMSVAPGDRGENRYGPDPLAR